MGTIPDIRTILNTESFRQYRVSEPTPLSAEDRETLTRIDNAAGNVHLCLTSGIEAIGNILKSAGLNDDVPVDAGAISDIGWLLEHLSKELVEVLDIQVFTIDRLALAEEAVKNGGGAK